MSKARTRFLSHDIAYVRADQLERNPHNWRKHPSEQQRAVGAAINRNGFVQPLIVRPRGDGTYQLVDGELRADLAGDDEVPVVIVDLDDAETREILLTLDSTAAMNEINADELRELLEATSLAELDGMEELAALLEADLAFATTDYLEEGDDGIEPMVPPDEISISVSVPSRDAQDARDVIREALTGAGITFSL